MIASPSKPRSGGPIRHLATALLLALSAACLSGALLAQDERKPAQPTHPMLFDARELLSPVFQDDPSLELPLASEFRSWGLATSPPKTWRLWFGLSGSREGLSTSIEEGRLNDWLMAGLAPNDERQVVVGLGGSQLLLHAPRSQHAALRTALAGLADHAAPRIVISLHQLAGERRPGSWPQDALGLDAVGREIARFETRSGRVTRFEAVTQYGVVNGTETDVAQKIAVTSPQSAAMGDGNTWVLRVDRLIDGRVHARLARRGFRADEVRTLDLGLAVNGRLQLPSGLSSITMASGTMKAGEALVFRIDGQTYALRADAIPLPKLDAKIFPHLMLIASASYPLNGLTSGVPALDFGRAESDADERTFSRVPREWSAMPMPDGRPDLTNVFDSLLGRHPDRAVFDNISWFVDGALVGVEGDVDQSRADAVKAKAVMMETLKSMAAMVEAPIGLEIVSVTASHADALQVDPERTYSAAELAAAGARRESFGLCTESGVGFLGFVGSERSFVMDSRISIAQEAVAPHPVVQVGVQGYAVGGAVFREGQRVRLTGSLLALAMGEDLRDFDRRAENSIVLEQPGLSRSETPLSALLTPGDGFRLAGTSPGPAVGEFTSVFARVR